MRRRAWAATALFALGAVLAVVGRATGAAGLDVAAGFLLVAAFALWLSLLPLWTRLLPALPNLRPLFPPLGPRERWCGRCGRPAPRTGSCPSCGVAPRVRRRRLQRKTSKELQEKE